MNNPFCWIHQNDPSWLLKPENINWMDPAKWIVHFKIRLLLNDIEAIIMRKNWLLVLSVKDIIIFQF